MAGVADALVAAVNKSMPGSARRLGASEIASDVVDYISTQSLAIDYAIGRPGIPVGRISLVVGPEGSGKSTLVYHLIAEVQRRGGIAVLADTETRFDRERALRIGIDPDNLVWLDGATVERTIQQIDTVVKTAREQVSDELILVVWDSVASTPTEKEVEGAFGEYQVGEHAQLVSQVMRRWARRMANQRIALVIVNQLRESIKFFGRAGGKTMIAEHPLGYHSSLTIEVVQVKKEGQRDAPDSILSRFYIKKNTVAPPFRAAMTRIMFADGFAKAQAKLQVAALVGWVRKSGAWYVYPAKVEKGDEQIKFQRKDWPRVLADNPELDEAFATLLPVTGDPPWAQGPEENETTPEPEDTVEED